ncbi:MAG TPA: HD domain-containing phosphohydrolase [Candidatus Polarisedimenticolia bacterium]|jgi:putative nucleotidyltransferase with HDIG domain|nr:HD domain-containing phosphohydrolase [Candidatus Polarisedimenticolia bacterium]
MSRPVVLIIDNASLTRVMHKEAIEGSCPKEIEVLTTASAEEALGTLYALRDQGRTIEMVIVSQGLPGIAGNRLLEIVSTQFPAVCRILLSDKPSLDEAIYAFNNSGVDRYIPLPWEKEDIKFTITSLLRQREMNRLNERLLSDLQMRNQELVVAFRNLDEAKKENERSYIQTVQSLAIALEAKDRYTAGHSQRVARFASLIARSMGLGREDLEVVHQVALLHDIGKIGMLDAILNKPANLTPEERELVKSHPVVGAQILAPVKTFERHVAGIRYHHEMFDGSGYPDKLKGEEIPQPARIVSLADAFDAMTSTRPYRIGLPLAFAMQEMIKMRGRQFCPLAVDAFVRVLQQTGVGDVQGLVNTAPGTGTGPNPAVTAAPAASAPAPTVGAPASAAAPETGTGGEGAAERPDDTHRKAA